MSNDLTVDLFLLCTLLSVILIFHALKTRKYLPAYAAGILAMPASIYIAFFPAFMFVPVLFPAMIMLAGQYLKSDKKRTAQLLFAPYLIVLAYFSLRVWMRYAN